MDKNPGVKLVFVAIFIALSVWILAAKDVTYGLDLKGGSTLTYSLQLAEEDEASAQNVVTETIAILQKRVDRVGLKEIDFIPVGFNEIKIQLPGMNKEATEDIKRILTDLGVLQWRIVAKPQDLAAEGVDLQAEEAKRAQMEEEAQKLAAIGKRGETYRGPLDKGFEWIASAADKRESQGDGVYVYTREDKSIGGDQLAEVFPSYDENNFPAVGFRLRPAGAGQMRKLTEANVGERMAIILNGELHSAPTLESVISDSGIIKGGMQGFDPKEITDLIATLKSGSLEIKPQLESENQIGPSLGAEAIQRGFLAIGIGFGAVIIFMLLIYRGAGGVAVLALFINLLFILSCLVFAEGTLTLPGIAGILLTVGMAVDASILIFERVREERAQGKNIHEAFSTGFERATVTILDANITTFLTAFCLYHVGTGPIKGFATTLMIGIVGTLICGVYFSRWIFAFLLQKGLYKEFRATRILQKPSFPFLRYSKMFAIISAIVVTGGVVAFIAHDDKLDLDFAGGSLVQMNTRTHLKPADVRNRFVRQEYPDAEVHAVGVDDGQGGYSVFEIRAKVFSDQEQKKFANAVAETFANDLVPKGFDVIPQVEGATVPDELSEFAEGFHFRLNTDKPVARDMVEAALVDAGVAKNKIVGGEAASAQSFEVWTGPMPPEVDSATLGIRIRARLELQGVNLSDPFPRTDYIGQKAVKDLIRYAILAILSSLVLILLYILFRFHDVRYGYAAVLALIHDVLLTLGVVALADMLGLVDAKLNLPIIAAFLAIIGYSLNDTIVIFDRIREKVAHTTGSFRKIVEDSINETLTRTIFTSLTTFVVVFCLFVLNRGQRSVLEGLAFALMVGIVTGTYSTIYVASSLVAYLKSRSGSESQAPPSGESRSRKKKRPIAAPQV